MLTLNSGFFLGQKFGPGFASLLLQTRLHSSNESNLFLDPLHPPYKNFTQTPFLNVHLGMAAKQGPVTPGGASQSRV